MIIAEKKELSFSPSLILIKEKKWTNFQLETKARKKILALASIHFGFPITLGKKTL